MRLILAALVVSGPIRQHLWKAHLAFWLALLVCVVLGLWLSIPGAVEKLSWIFPLRGKWLRRLVKGVAIAFGVFCLMLFTSSGLDFFLIFPWMAK
jgi:hypothetical protein